MHEEAARVKQQHRQECEGLNRDHDATKDRFNLVIKDMNEKHSRDKADWDQQTLRTNEGYRAEISRLNEEHAALLRKQ
jgi:hypothetical protein